LGGQGWREGAASKKTGLNLPARDFPIRNFPVHKIFPAILLFVRKNLIVQTFVRNFFGFFRFRTGKNLAGEISIRNFLRFSTFDWKILRLLKFHGQKKSVFSDASAGPVSQDLRRRSELVAELTIFFSTFNRKYFWFFRFRSDIPEILGYERQYTAKNSVTTPFTQQNGIVFPGYNQGTFSKKCS
jgi:hypothetical protein